MIKDTSDEQIKVIFCETGKRARMLETDNNLGCFQKLVGGWIEEYMPFDDDVAIVCNEEGKTMGLPLNRGITDENGQLLDIIAGDFFIAYAPYNSERFLSMPPELEKKYLEKYELPETFRMGERGISVSKFDPVDKTSGRNSAEYER